MKKLFVIAAVIALAFCMFAIANAEDQAAPPPPPPAAPPPPPPPPPMAPEKVQVIALSAEQLKAIKAAPMGAEITLSKKQIKKIVKMWADFKGTTAKVAQADVFQKVMVAVTMKDGALMSCAKPADKPKDKGKDKGKDKPKADATPAPTK
jgi:hypothetical protein